MSDQGLKLSGPQKRVLREWLAADMAQGKRTWRVPLRRHLASCRALAKKGLMDSEIFHARSSTYMYRLTEAGERATNE